MAIKNVVLVGATGNMGSTIYEALKASPSNFNITILTRADSKSELPEGANVIRHNFDDPALVDALRGQDAVITALNMMGTMSQIPLIEASVKAGVKKFIPTEFGVDSTNPTVAGLLSTYEAKTKVLNALKAASEANPSFTYSGIICGGFFDMGLQMGFLGFDLKAKTATIFDGGDLQITYSTMAQAALATVRVLEKDISGYVHCASLTASQNQILEALERTTGEKFERKEETAQNYHNMSEGMMKSEDAGVQMNGFFLRIIRIVFGEDSHAHWGKGDNEKLGLKESSLDDAVKLVLGKQ